MNDRSTLLLLGHHLKELKLPSFLREYGKMAAQCAAEGVDHPQYLLRLAELVLIGRHQRMVERRIRAARFPAERDLAVAEACHSGGDAPHLPAHRGQHPLHGGRAVGSGFELSSPVLRSGETVARSVVVGTSVKPHAFYSPRFSRVLSGPGGCWEGCNHARKTPPESAA